MGNGFCDACLNQQPKDQGILVNAQNKLDQSNQNNLVIFK